LYRYVEGRDPGTPGNVLLDEDDDGVAAAEGGAGDDAMAMTTSGAGGEGAALAAGAAAEGAPRWPTPEALAAVPPTAQVRLYSCRIQLTHSA
jgi:hypothetical protein